MMETHKVFELNKKKNEQKYADLYRTKKLKYLKLRVFVVPIIIGSIFLCILIIKDLTKGVYHNNVGIKKSAVYSQFNLKLHKTESLDKSLGSLSLTRPKRSRAPKVLIFKHYKMQDEKKFDKEFFQNFFHKTSSLHQPTRSSRIVRQVQAEQKDYNMQLKDYYAKDLNNSTVMKEMSSLNPAMDAIKLVASAITCQEYKGNCTLDCSKGSVSYIDENLNELQIKCRNSDLNLMVSKCEFNFRTLDNSFFYGDFSLGYLAINECNLETIKSTAFKHNNVKKLHTLILTNNQLISLRSDTFDGLTNLLNFEFVQAPLATAFEGEGFLMPLANSLQEAIIQPRKNDSNRIDPFDWWQKLQMVSLTNLDISNTNLQGILNSSTFQPFVALECLILNNCNLLRVEADIFNFVKSSFKYLDLRFNRLKTLDNYFLQKLAIPSIELNLGSNEWHCECGNEMFQYFAEYDVKLTEDIICATPETWKYIELKHVIEECKESETTFKTVPFTSTSVSTTITTTAPSTTTVISNTNTTSVTQTTPHTNTTNAANNYNTTTTATIPYTTTMTVSSPYTIPTSTPNQSNLIPIKCHLNEEQTESSSKYVRIPMAKFSLHKNSSTSLTVTVQQSTGPQNFFIIYSTKYNDYDYVYGADDSDIQEGVSKIEGNIYIPGLLPSVAYVFCLLVESSVTVSPFDCKANILQPKSPKIVWILAQDKVWFFSVNIIAAILFFLISLLTGCILLRHNPQWLKTHNNDNKSSKETLSSFNLSSLSQQSSHYLNSTPRSQSANDETVIYDSQHQVPYFRAPILPPAPDSCLTDVGNKCVTKDCSLNIDYWDVSQTSSYCLSSLTHSQNVSDETVIYDSQHAVPNLTAPKLPPATETRQTISSSSCSTDVGYRSDTKNSSQNRDYLEVPQTYSYCLSSLTPSQNVSDETLIYNSQHVVPTFRAPILPPADKICRKTCTSASSTRVRKGSALKYSSTNMDYLDIIEDEPDYQTIDY